MGFTPGFSFFLKSLLFSVKLCVSVFVFLVFLYMEVYMGRTVPTFTMVLQQEIASWSKFRRGLRKEDQDALDELFRAAHLQLAGSAYAARAIPFESVAMSMLLAQQRMIKELQQEIQKIRCQVSGVGCQETHPLNPPLLTSEERRG